MNELIFFVYTIIVALSALICLVLGPYALTALLCIEVILMNLFVMKQITLFGLCATASDALGIGAALCLNLLQEYYGRAQARTAIFISFICSFFYLSTTFLHLAYVPHTNDCSQLHFVALLTPVPRIIIASLVTYLFVQYFESWFYEILKNYYSNRFLVIRNYITISIAQGVDTILFSFLGLYGILPSLWSIIIISYSIKLITIGIATPFLALSRRIHKNIHV